MAVSTIDQAGLRLPLRIRTRLGPAPAYAARFMLAERIAELAYVQIVEDAFGTPPCTIGVFLQRDTGPSRKRPPAILFCRISNAGISVEGLTDTERHQVLSRGWGQLENHRIRLFMPRDSRELETCWSILYRAYGSIINTPARAAAMPRAYAADLPEISRTSLC
jgi:hypothetical protein